MDVSFNSFVWKESTFACISHCYIRQTSVRFWVMTCKTFVRIMHEHENMSKLFCYHRLALYSFQLQPTRLSSPNIVLMSLKTIVTVLLSNSFLIWVLGHSKNSFQNTFSKRQQKSQSIILYKTNQRVTLFPR